MTDYFWCSSGEDGTRIKRLTRPEVDRRLDDMVRDGSIPLFLTEVPVEDKGCWMHVPENAILILRGEIIIPKPVETVKKLEII